MIVPSSAVKRIILASMFGTLLNSQIIHGEEFSSPALGKQQKSKLRGRGSQASKLDHFSHTADSFQDPYAKDNISPNDNEGSVADQDQDHGRQLQPQTSSSSPSPGAIIENNRIKLGVRPTGSLFVENGGVPSVNATIVGSTVSTVSTDTVGIRYKLPDGSGESEGAAWLGYVEGWGVSADGDKGWSLYNQNGMAMTN